MHVLFFIFSGRSTKDRKAYGGKIINTSSAIILAESCDFQQSVIFRYQRFSYLSKSRSSGRLIWENQLANIQNWENWTGETKQSVLLYNHSKARKTTP